MGFFQKMNAALARFMYGRNGVDQLNRALFAVYLLLWILQPLIAGILRSDFLSNVFGMVIWLLAALIIFRTFSKNLYKRRAENQKWVNFWYGFKSRQAGAKARHADKDHKYFTCKSCKAICRVPVGKGKIVITCPKCGNQIQAKT